MRSLGLINILLLIFYTGVLNAQVVMNYDKLREHPCLLKLFSHLEDELNEVIDSSSAAIIAYYHVDSQHRLIRYDSSRLFSSTTQNLDLTGIDSVFRDVNLVDVYCQRLPEGRLIIPVAVLHPVWTFWHPLIASDFRKLEDARQLLQSHRVNNKEEVVNIFFLRRHFQWKGGKYRDYISEY